MLLSIIWVYPAGQAEQLVYLSARKDIRLEIYLGGTQCVISGQERLYIVVQQVTDKILQEAFASFLGCRLPVRLIFPHSLFNFIGHLLPDDFYSNTHRYCGRISMPDPLPDWQADVPGHFYIQVR